MVNPWAHLWAKYVNAIQSLDFVKTSAPKHFPRFNGGVCACTYVCDSCVYIHKIFSFRHIVNAAPAQSLFHIKRMFWQITVNGCESFWSTVIAFRLRQQQQRKYTNE